MSVGRGQSLACLCGTCCSSLVVSTVRCRLGTIGVPQTPTPMPTPWPALMLAAAPRRPLIAPNTLQPPAHTPPCSADAFGDDDWLVALRKTVRAAMDARKQVLVRLPLLPHTPPPKGSLPPGGQGRGSGAAAALSMAGLSCRQACPCARVGLGQPSPRRARLQRAAPDRCGVWVNTQQRWASGPLTRPVQVAWAPTLCKCCLAAWLGVPFTVFAAPFLAPS